MDLSPSKVEKAREAIDFLSSLPGTTSTPNTSSASATTHANTGETGDVMKSADKAIDALKRMRAGMKADNAISRKKARDEVSRVFNTKRARIDKGNENKPAWRHKFVCVAYTCQDRMPMTDYDKEELYQAGLGEKEILFESLDLSQQQFRDRLMKEFPRLKAGGGFQLLKGKPNSRNLETLSMAVHASPALLKQRVGTARTYIRPVQRDLDLTPLAKNDIIDVPEEKCLTCDGVYPLDQLAAHATECGKALLEIEREMAGKVERANEKTTAEQPVDLTDETPLYESGRDSPFSVGDDYSPIHSSDDEPSVEAVLYQHAVNQSLSATSNSSVVTDSGSMKNTDEVVSVQDLVKTMQRTLMGSVEDRLILEVRRKFIMKDALKEARKEKFNVKKFVKIKFAGEGAIDYGGPRREFFRLLGNTIMDKYFRGKESQKFFSQNVSAIQEDELFSIGRYMAMSILQGGNGFPFLAPPVYEYLVSGKCTGVNVENTVVPEQVLQFLLAKIESAANETELRVTLQIDEALDLICATGYRKAVCTVRVEDKGRIRAALLDYHCLLKVKGEMDQFSDGLSAVGVLSFLRKYPDLMRHFFMDTEQGKVDADDLKELFKTKVYSEEGCIRRDKEEEAWIHFSDFLDECEATNGNTNCTSIVDVLKFVSGAARVPPLGFGKNPKVEFLPVINRFGWPLKLATASTCDIIFRLPTCHGERYDLFKESMIMSIKDNDGFGGV